MDNQSFITLSKFTVEARKVIGTINPARLLKDATYSEAIFEKVDASDDTALIVLSLELRQQLGLLDIAPSDAVAKKPLERMIEPTITASIPPQKYMFGARG
ncbi:MAG: hypothetical protein U1E13_00140 [Methylophilaceae bacterium]|nr:hypothetical protein [Methylophilaceae bacterium]